MIEKISEKAGRGPSGEEKKLREEIENGERREPPFECENARGICMDICALESTCEIIEKRPA
jgi:hypothetical protein